MKVSDFVEVEYVGRIKDSGEIFDLTKEDVAKKENVYDPKVSYKPVVLILGADFIIKGLDEALREMDVGEKKVVDIPPEKAFGDRKADFVRTMPLAQFKEQNLDPFPGSVVNIGNLRGRILSVDGGRVKVDFNHPLAGKTLEYEIEVKSLIKEKPDKVKSIVTYFTGIEDVEVVCERKGEGEGGPETVEINIKKDVGIARPVKKMVSDAIFKWCDVEKVRFVEVFEKSKPVESEAVKTAEKEVNREINI